MTAVFRFGAHSVASTRRLAPVRNARTCGHSSTHGVGAMESGGAAQRTVQGESVVDVTAFHGRRDP